ncbi:MAG: hypothetical protein OSA51_05055 [Octadecabacter sp.]|nr:hypothetical protein [Octadecabacter sp.]
MGTYREILRLKVRHSYYQANPIPINIVPNDAVAFAAQGLLIRRQGEDVLVIADATEVPSVLEFAIKPTDLSVIAVTKGADWLECPVITVPDSKNDVDFNPLSGTSGVQKMGDLVLALLRVAPQTQGRRVTISFDAVTSFWAYHVIGPGSKSAIIEDPEEEIFFDQIDPVPLPDGRLAHVLRSRTALPARARATQRFALKTPSLFGSKTLVPVLPAAGHEFVSVPVPGSSQTFVQSDIFISIF